MNKKTATIYIDAISIIAPGLNGWQDSLPVLSGQEEYSAKPLEKLTATLLPANERRRTTQLIKLALHAAETCLDLNKNTAENYATVFASSDGDHAITDKICRALAMPDQLVSPTQFHNSVHNAAAGYWAIAAHAELSSTSLSAGDETFASGLVDAASFVTIEKHPALFVAYDYPAVSPLSEARQLDAPFAVALCLSHVKSEQCIAELRLNIVDESKTTQCDDQQLEVLRSINPAARSLPLLQAIARGNKGEISIPHVNSTSLQIEIG